MVGTARVQQALGSMSGPQHCLFPALETVRAQWGPRRRWGGQGGDFLPSAGPDQRRSWCGEAGCRHVRLTPDWELPTKCYRLVT